MTAPHEPLVLALVGATGTVGRTVLEVLDELDVPVKALRPFASPRSAGTTVSFRDDDLKVEAPRDGAFRGCDVAIFCAGPAAAPTPAPPPGRRRRSPRRSRGRPPRAAPPP